jgi:hypothetical protein
VLSFCRACETAHSQPLAELGVKSGFATLN